jgi:hypothetical protein
MAPGVGYLSKFQRVAKTQLRLEWEPSPPLGEVLGSAAGTFIVTIQI